MRRAVILAAVLVAGCGGDDGAASGDGGPDPTGDGGSEPDVDAGNGDDPVEPTATLSERLQTFDISVPEGVKAGVSSWRIWGSASLGVSPVYTAPLANCETLVCFTTGSGDSITPRVARISGTGTLVEVHDLTSGLECRGLAAEQDGHYAALLWDDDADEIFVQRYDAAGEPAGAAEELTNASNTPDDFNIGDSRLEFGGDRYGAYYHVHSNDGHEGDTLKWVTTAGSESTSWTWGCSHSMSALLRYNPADSKFMPACVTDCFPGTDPDESESPFLNTSIGAIYINHDDAKVMDVNGGCNGKVAAELGGAAIAPSGWKMVFNAHQDSATLGQSSYDSTSMNQDIGFVSVAAGYGSGSVVWLTSTGDVDEADATIARWRPEGDETEQYVVGWMEPGPSARYWLARVDGSGTVLEGPVDISAQAGWGRRDDPMRRHHDDDVVWAWFDSPGATTLHLARLASGQDYQCASF